MGKHELQKNEIRGLQNKENINKDELQINEIRGLQNKENIDKDESLQKDWLEGYQLIVSQKLKFSDKRKVNSALSDARKKVEIENIVHNTELVKQMYNLQREKTEKDINTSFILAKTKQNKGLTVDLGEKTESVEIVLSQSIVSRLALMCELKEKTMKTLCINDESDPALKELAEQELNRITEAAKDDIKALRIRGKACKLILDRDIAELTGE